MKKSHDKVISKEVTRSDFLLSELPLSNTGVVSSALSAFYPVNSYRDTFGPIYFSLHSSTEYLDLSSAFIYLQLSIQKSKKSTPKAAATTGTTTTTAAAQGGTEEEPSFNLTDADSVAFINNVGASIFESIYTEVQNVQVCSLPPLMPYLSHFQDLVYRNNKANQQILKLQLFYPDTNELNVNSNEGFATRRKLTAGSKSVETFAKICDPLFFNQPKVIPPNIVINLTCRRSAPAFVLTGTDPRRTVGSEAFPYKYIIENCILYCKKIALNHNLVKQHALLWNSGKKFQYPLRVNTMRVIPLPKDILQFQTDVLWNGNLPKFILGTFVKSDAISGTLSDIPFIFEHNDLQNVVMKVDGDINLWKKLDFNMRDEHFSLSFHSVSSIFAKFNSKYTPEDMKNFGFFFGFEITPEFSPKALHKPISGQLMLSLNFRKKLEESISMLIFAESEGLVSISKEGVTSEVIIQ